MTWGEERQQRRAELMARVDARKLSAGRELRSRAVVRATTVRAELSLDALIAAIGDRVAGVGGWPATKHRAYAEHLVQPYCDCGPVHSDEVGWEFCPHAKDEGFA